MIVSVTGCSGSGKSTIVKRLLQASNQNSFCCLHLDSYYKDQSHLSVDERKRINFDHPDAIELDLFSYHVTELNAGRAVQKPIYNFTTHTREKHYENIIPQENILFEGLHVFYTPALRALADFKIFIDTDVDLCFIRRLSRDIKKRGRSIECVIEQYLSTVRPIQQEIIIPMKKYADITIDNNQPSDKSLGKAVDQIKVKCDL